MSIAAGIDGFADGIAVAMGKIVPDPSRAAGIREAVVVTTAMTLSPVFLRGRPVAARWILGDTNSPSIPP
ncbi:hypothetical protein [Streptomyces sp. cf386]|uniref:hypothetical protein n=1 Tax=Streptomyces sp. cf386 TaxID=1761904 RepID=UPI00115FC41B|nr:hypothetical protein [Streptomyces sp. cf386]